MRRIMLGAVALLFSAGAAAAQFFIIPIPTGNQLGAPVPVAFESAQPITLTAYYQGLDKSIKETVCPTPCTIPIPGGAAIRLKVQGPPGYSGYKAPPDLKWSRKGGKYVMNPNPVNLDLIWVGPGDEPPPLVQ